VFAHEKLHVYNKALAFASTAAALTSRWDKKHALVDHLARAAESIVLNLAEAARQRGAPARLRIADYAIGSSLECAGCLDIARIKKLNFDYSGEKQRLCEITKMLVGLRKGWTQFFGEESVSYRADTSQTEPQFLFQHETLAVYQAALEFVEWFISRPDAQELSNRLFRQLDEAATAIVLNIAEGNGRYAELDQQRFLKIADSATVKAAVYLDLCVQKAVLRKTEVASGKELLRKISAMVSAM
jgi:four helix bundle protein